MLEKYAIESEWMEEQLKTVKWAREQKKKIPEKNYKDNKTPGGPYWITGGFMLDNLNRVKKLVRQLLLCIVTVVPSKKNKVSGNK